MSNINKTPAQMNGDNALRFAFNREDASITINGFLGSKVGNRVTLEMPAANQEIWRMYDLISAFSADVSGTNITNIPDAAMPLLKAGQHILTAYNDYDITIVSVDQSTNSAVISASTVTSGAGISVKASTRILKYKLTYDNASKTNLMDSERIG